MTNADMSAWLGPAADQLTAEQIDRFERVWNDIADDDRRDNPERVEAVLSAAVQYLLGETSIDEAGAQRAATRTSSFIASAAAQQIAIMAVEDGMSETEAARRASIDRMWLRKRLGK